MTSKIQVFHDSEYNINFGFKDQQHIDILKKQIESGDEIPIHVYVEDGIYKIIDGGHTYAAYRQLDLTPKLIIVKDFESDAEKIAFSRHRNLNRLKQSPVSYTRCIMKEL